MSCPSETSVEKALALRPAWECACCGWTGQNNTWVNKPKPIQSYTRVAIQYTTGKTMAARNRQEVMATTKFHNVMVVGLINEDRSIKSPLRSASLPSHSRRMLSRSRAARSALSSSAHLHEDVACSGY